MSVFELISSETKPLTADVAKEFSEMQASPTERVLNKHRVKHLREKAEAGVLTPFGWSVAVVDGTRYRMNGQHSSNMLTAMNGSFPEGLKVHMDTYNVSSMDGLAVLFRQFDDRASSRNLGDVAGAYQGLQSALSGVHKDSAKKAVEGVNWKRKSIDGQVGYKGDDVYQLFNQAALHSFVIWAGETLSVKTPEMKRIQVLSAMYATFDANEEKARVFWENVSRGGVEYKDHHPTTILSDWLVKAKNSEFKKPPKPAAFYNASLYAWNAWRKDQELTNINIGKLKSDLQPVS